MNPRGQLTSFAVCQDERVGSAAGHLQHPCLLRSVQRQRDRRGLQYVLIPPGWKKKEQVHSQPHRPRVIALPASDLTLSDPHNAPQRSEGLVQPPERVAELRPEPQAPGRDPRQPAASGEPSWVIHAICIRGEQRQRPTTISQ